MNFKNEIQLRGIVTAIRPLPRGPRTMYSLTVKTERAWKNKDGQATIQEELHPCIAWPGKIIPAERLRDIRPGTVVFIKGHMSYKPEAHVFVESITVSKETNTGIAPGIKI